MTARIAGFVTRADAGLIPPRSVSHNIDATGGGVTGHYGGGDPIRINNHADCIRVWKGWQAFHMGPERGWVDIAYTGGICPHGYAFAGRGVGVRTAANGTNGGNFTFYAVVFILGGDQQPTREAWDAFEWWVMHLRGKGAGDRVVPHSWHKPTGCPGPHVRSQLDQYDNQPIEDDDMSQKAEQQIAEIHDYLGIQTIDGRGRMQAAGGEETGGWNWSNYAVKAWPSIVAAMVAGKIDIDVEVDAETADEIAGALLEQLPDAVLDRMSERLGT